MNKKLVGIVAIALMSVLFSCIVCADKVCSSVKKDELPENSLCRHSVLFDFNDEEMTLDNVYTNARVENLIDDVSFFGDTAVVLENGCEITEGTMCSGMVVEIYHDGELYGSYTVSEILEPIWEQFATEKTNSSMLKAAAGNQYGFVLPIDHMSLKFQSNGGNISQDFGKNRGGTSTYDLDHRGIDIGSSADISIPGKPIRAVASGTVEWIQVWNGSISGDQSWGNCVKIDHGNGYHTLYAHMSDRHR